MKYFTPDLIEQFGSDDDSLARFANEELERRSEMYREHLRAIAADLPRQFRELFEHFYLHDARVTLPLTPEHAWLDLYKYKLPGPTSGGETPRGPAGRSPLFPVHLRLDPPPRSNLVLNYRSVLIEGVERHPSLTEDDGPHPEWQYDEVEVISRGPTSEFRHSILFTGGLELRLRFHDFDFATIKPTEDAHGVDESELREMSSKG